MPKAILVIDEMPTGCIGCPCYYEDKGRCQNTWESVEDDFARPSWCPLKPMPQKKVDENGAISADVRFSLQKEWIKNELDFVSGWDACVEELEK